MTYFPCCDHVGFYIDRAAGKDKAEVVQKKEEVTAKQKKQKKMVDCLIGRLLGRMFGWLVIVIVGWLLVGL